MGRRRCSGPPLALPQYEAVAEDGAYLVDIALTGDCLIAAGIISYLGAFTPSFRERCVTDWVAACREEMAAIR